MVVDVFWMLCLLVWFVTYILRERGIEREQRERDRGREGKGKKKHNCSKWKRAENSREKSGASDRI